MRRTFRLAQRFGNRALLTRTGVGIFLQRQCRAVRVVIPSESHPVKINVAVFMPPPAVLKTTLSRSRAYSIRENMFKRALFLFITRRHKGHKGFFGATWFLTCEIWRRQAVFRATPLFEQVCGGRVARKSGAAIRAQRGPCLQVVFHIKLPCRAERGMARRLHYLPRLLQNSSWHGRPAHETRARCPCRTCRQGFL